MRVWLWVLWVVGERSTWGALLQTGERKQGRRRRIVLRNPSSVDRDVLWLAEGGEAQAIGRVEAFGELEIETFVGHDIGWARANESVVEESITVTSSLERVLLGGDLESSAASYRELPRPSSEELERLDGVLSRGVSAEALTREVATAGTRGAYYALRVDSVAAWSAALDDAEFRGVATRHATSFDGRVSPTAAAFEAEDGSLAVVYENGSPCESEFCDGAFAYKSGSSWFSFRVAGRLPLPSHLDQVDLLVPRKRQRILRFGCDPNAVWLSRLGRVTCVDDRPANRLAAADDAADLGKLPLHVTPTLPRRRGFDLVYAADDPSDLVPGRLALPSPAGAPDFNHSRSVLRPGGAWLLSTRAAHRLLATAPVADLVCAAALHDDAPSSSSNSRPTLTDQHWALGANDDAAYARCELLSRRAARRRRRSAEHLL